ncbi:hypothetical protein RRG08_018563 [Elysia crispata]|uniref:Copper transport protein n=1 Tax=Elysia crispata TaxID=231223 RepID=A0AAE0Y0I9_9GAST|nr:hypothetical protein RRG08_018563 [Elysia crispata]
MDHSMMMMNNTAGMANAMMGHVMNASMANSTMVDHSMHGHNHSVPGVDHPMHNHDHTDHMHNHDHSDHMHNHDHTGDGTGMGTMDGMDHSHHQAGTGGGGHDGHMMDMHGMKMYFHDGVDEYVLFEECKTNSTETLILACFIVFAVAVLYEGLKFFREALLQRSLLQTQPRARYLDSKQPGSSQEQMVISGGGASMSSRILSKGHFIQSLLHMVQVFVSYCLMLVFMTYNIWLCLAVVVGAGVGYFLFGWKRAVIVDTNEHCH